MSVNLFNAFWLLLFDNTKLVIELSPINWSFIFIIFSLLQISLDNSFGTVFVWVQVNITTAVSKRSFYKTTLRNLIYSQPTHTKKVWN